MENTYIGTVCKVKTATVNCSHYFLYEILRARVMYLDFLLYISQLPLALNSIVCNLSEKVGLFRFTEICIYYILLQIRHKKNLPHAYVQINTNFYVHSNATLT